MSYFEIDTAFQAKSYSVKDFYKIRNPCFYIPVFQRPYSWDKDNVDRLFYDVISGLERIVDPSFSDSLTFIGTIICIHDIKYTNVNPSLRPELPGRVMVIIDGQQRLTSICIINSLLHMEMSKLLKKFEKSDVEQFSWIHNQCKKSIVELEQTLWEDQSYGEGLSRYYPKIIRAIDDQWSTKRNESKYNSPIGNYLYSYMRYVKDNEKAPFKFENLQKDTKLADKYTILINIRKNMLKHVKDIGDGVFEDFPKVLKILNEDKILEILLGHVPPKSVKEYIGNGNNDMFYKHFKYLLNLLLFSNYLNRCVAVTVVTTTKEEYAFDMFEALNTTGEPLSAFETFKPKIVEAEYKNGNPDFEASPSYQLVETIDVYLSQFSKAIERQKATSELLIPFALIESGKKIGNKLNQQRNYLNTNFRSLKTISEQRIFLNNMANVASFLKECWPYKSLKKPNIPLAINYELNDDSAVLCLDLLKKMKHSICIAILSAFFTKMLESDEENKEELVNEFMESILAVTAFSVIWRSMDKGTRGIDSIYRDLLNEGIKDESVEIDGFCRSVRGNFSSITVESLKKYFRIKLENNNFTNKNDWINILKTKPVYKYSQPLTRFLLFLSINDTEPDKNQNPLLESARTNHLDILNYKSWASDELMTVEHIAPQKENGFWPNSDLYEEEQELIHTIGNLSLLPSGENNIVNNNSWDIKKHLFIIFASNTENELKQNIASAKTKGINISRKKEEILKSSTTLKFIKPIANYNGEWDKDIVELRSENFAKLSWRSLSSWLGFE